MRDGSIAEQSVRRHDLGDYTVISGRLLCVDPVRIDLLFTMS
jgi:hypothetical protein